MYRVFVRNWWRIGTNGERLPESNARRYTIDHASSEEEARAICKAYNDTHEPGRLSRKAEYTDA